MFRNTDRTIDQKVAALEEAMRRVQSSTATTPNITSYSALTGKPTDLVTVAELNAALAPLQTDDLLAWMAYTA